MKVFRLIIAGSLLFSVSAQAEDEAKSQEYYDKEIEEGLQQLTTELQTMTGEMVKYMNAFNKALDKSMPQLSHNMGKLIASMKPVAETMQKNLDAFSKEVNHRLEEQETEKPLKKESPAFVSPNDVVFLEPITESENIAEEIDAELAQFNQEEKTTKIKLFPSTIE